MCVFVLIIDSSQLYQLLHSDNFIDIVLQDFCDVVGHYDDTNSPPHSRLYFRKTIPADAEPVPAKGACNLQFVDSPLESRASPCVVLEPNVAITLSSKTALFVSFMFSTLMLFN